MIVHVVFIALSIRCIYLLIKLNVCIKTYYCKTVSSIVSKVSPVYTDYNILSVMFTL